MTRPFRPRRRVLVLCYYSSQGRKGVSMIYVVGCVSVCLCYTEGKSKRTFALTVRRGKNETTSIFKVRLERQSRKVSSNLGQSNKSRTGEEGICFARTSIQPPVQNPRSFLCLQIDLACRIRHVLGSQSACKREGKGRNWTCIVIRDWVSQGRLNSITRHESPRTLI
jgi:hypothetical protein